MCASKRRKKRKLQVVRKPGVEHKSVRLKLKCFFNNSPSLIMSNRLSSTINLHRHYKTEVHETIQDTSNRKQGQL